MYNTRQKKEKQFGKTMKDMGFGFETRQNGLQSAAVPQQNFRPPTYSMPNYSVPSYTGMQPVSNMPKFTPPGYNVPNYSTGLQPDYSMPSYGLPNYSLQQGNYTQQQNYADRQAAQLKKAYENTVARYNKQQKQQASKAGQIKAAYSNMAKQNSVPSKGDIREQYAYIQERLEKGAITARQANDELDRLLGRPVDTRTDEEKAAETRDRLAYNVQVGQKPKQKPVQKPAIKRKPNRPPARGDIRELYAKVQEDLENRRITKEQADEELQWISDTWQPSRTRDEETQQPTPMSTASSMNSGTPGELSADDTSNDKIKVSSAIRRAERIFWPDGDVPPKDSGEYASTILVYLESNYEDTEPARYLTAEQIQAAYEYRDKAEESRDILGGEAGKISSGFGWRTLNGNRENHKGIDINIGDGREDFNKPLNSAWYGEVVYASDENNMHPQRGYYIDIVIDRDPQYEPDRPPYRYMPEIKIRMEHLNGPPLLSAGNAVVTGLIIGAIGDSAANGQSHLHLELLIDGKVVNPLDYPELLAI